MKNLPQQVEWTRKESALDLKPYLPEILLLVMDLS